MIACKLSLSISAMTGLAERRPAIVNCVDNLLSEEKLIQDSVIELLIGLHLWLWGMHRVCICVYVFVSMR